MQDPGLDRHTWESELSALEDELRDRPAEALPELDDLVGRMLEETGYDLTDPVARDGDEREVVAEYLAAHETALAAQDGWQDVDPGDVAAAINGLRAVYEHLVTERAATGQ